MKKILSFLLAFSILVGHFGCSTFKTVPKQEAAMTVSKKNFLIVHAPGMRYELSNYQFTDTGLKGDLKTFEGGNLNTMHVFTDMHFSLPGHSMAMLPVFIPQDHIQKIKYARPSTLKTILFVGGILAVITLVGMNSIQINYLSSY